jgi:hypothetical protein
VAGPTSPAVQSLRALWEAEDDVVGGFLLAGIYCQAIRADEPPREVVERLFKALPSSEAWPAFRSMLLEVLEGEAAES